MIGIVVGIMVAVVGIIVASPVAYAGNEKSIVIAAAGGNVANDEF